MKRGCYYLFSLGIIGILAGCAYKVREIEPRERNNPTILIQNEGLEPLTLRTDYGRIGIIGTREIRCFELRSNSLPTQISFVSEGREYLTQPFNPESQTGRWYMRIGTTPLFDVLSLTPMDDSCEAGKSYVEVKDGFRIRGRD